MKSEKENKNEIKSRHLYISLNFNEIRELRELVGHTHFNNLFLSKHDLYIKEYKPINFILTGTTNGITSFLSFNNGSCKEKVKTRLSLIATDNTICDLEIIDGKLCFPKFRKLTQEALMKINEIDMQINKLKEDKQNYLNSIFDTLPLMELYDLPPQFLNPNDENKQELLRDILWRLKNGSNYTNKNKHKNKKRIE